MRASELASAAERDRLSGVSFSARKAWMSAVAGAAINVTGMPIETAIAAVTPGAPLWPSLGSALAGAAILLALWLVRRRPRLPIALSLYLLNTLIVVGALFVLDHAFALSRERWVPFQANKLGCLITALIAPNGVLGVVGILAHAGSSALNFALLPEAVQRHIGAVEPLASVAFGLAGLVALLLRLRGMMLERRVVRAQAEVAALRRFAATVRQLKDQMNTPLQTIELSVNLLNRGKLSPEAALERMSRALERLRRINDVLTQYERSFVDRREGEGDSVGTVFEDSKLA